MSEEIDHSLYTLNPENRYITKEFIETTLSNYKVDHKVKNLATFQQAMTHISYLIRDKKFFNNNKTRQYQLISTDIEPIKDPKSAIPLQEESYERLEFLGDAVIHLVLAEYFYKRYEVQDEGFLTRLRTKIEQGETLSELAKAIGLQDYVLLSKHIEMNNGREKHSNILEDAFEAFIGALFYEAGFNACNIFLTDLIESEIDLPYLLNKETNFKDKLMRIFHKEKWEDPQYGTFDISGPDTKKTFTMFVKRQKNPHDKGEIIGLGMGASKKKGEQQAAKQALVELGYYKEDNDSDAESFEEYDSDDA